MRILFIHAGHHVVRYYRGEGVLEQLKKIAPVTITYPTGDTFRDVMNCDIVYFLRTTDNKSREIVTMAKNTGRKVWYDLDDDYKAVTPDSTAFMHYQQKSVQDGFDWMIQNSDIRTFSTKALMDKYGKQGDVIIPNAIDDYTFSLDFQDVERKYLVWRGGATHQADLMHYSEALKGAMSLFPDRLVFMGYSPWWIEGKYNFLPYHADYYSYMRALRERINPLAMFVPLVDNQFNRCKSNIAALEAIYCGAIPIVPELPEWDIPQALKYESEGGFRDCLSLSAGLGVNAAKAMHKENIAWMRKGYILSVTNLKRLEVIRRMM